MLEKGYSYLFKNASKLGHWREPRSTALAVMCLAMRNDGESRWLLELGNWIRSNQTKKGSMKGSWGDEVWDTAMCVMALRDLRVPAEDRSIRTAMSWMQDIFSCNGKNNWHYEPWETSWALMAIFRCDTYPELVNIPEAIKWLSALQSDEGEDKGKIVSPHYTAYFILLHDFFSDTRHSHEKIDPKEFHELKDLLSGTSKKCSQYLLSQLELAADDKLWTGEAWSNGQILWALSRANEFPFDNSRLVKKIVNWFKTTQKKKGNWSDVEDTASAILGLCEFARGIIRAEVKAAGAKERIISQLETDLKKAVPLPKLWIKKPIYEFDQDTGFVSLNARKKYILWITGSVAAVAAIITFIQNMQWIYNKLDQLRDIVGRIW